MARHFAFIGENSKKAAEAAECAGSQGRFWEYRELLFRNQSQLRALSTPDQGTGKAVEKLKEWAGQVSLDVPGFSACLDSGRYAGWVQAESDEARQLRIPGTPAFFVDGQLVRGAGGAIPTHEEIKAAVDQAIAKKGR